MSSSLASNEELKDVLFFQQIDYYRVGFTGEDLGGKTFSLVAKEIWAGEIVAVDTIIDTSLNSNLSPLDGDSLVITVIGRKSGEEELSLQFKFPEFSSRRTFQATQSDDYSLRVTGSKLTIQPGVAFAAFVYILPYLDDGWKLYCAVDSSGEEVEDWGKEFDLPHYIIFEMRFF